MKLASKALENVYKFEHKFEASSKAYKGKLMSGARERSTKRYFKDLAARSRRKQNKQNFDTFRRAEQPNSEDEFLEDLHYANFLGVKESAIGIPYNTPQNEGLVNINLCDIMRPTPETVPISNDDRDHRSENSLSEDDDEDDEDDLDMRQVERECNTAAYLRFTSIEEDGNIIVKSNGWCYKRLRSEKADHDPEEPNAKRSKIVEEEDTIQEATTVDINTLIAYMRRQVHIAQNLSQQNM